MRNLTDTEMLAVAGGDLSTPLPPVDEGKAKNNNGYGNGAESGPAPGRSGLRNPQLLEDNLGPLGDR